MKLVVGLGNPGRQYAETRHNVGWMVLDRLAARSGWSGRAKERDAAATSRGRVGDLDVMLARPLTYMNDSGIAVRKILAREHVLLADVLIVADDFALPFGKLRIRPSGTAGGHNGLRSIIAELETQQFARLRIGIGEPRRDAVDHVLSRFSDAERRHLSALLDAAADAIETWAREGAASAANRWNAWELEGTGPPPRPIPAGAADRGVAAEESSAASSGESSRPAGMERPADDASTGQPQPGPGEVGGPPGSDGIRRTRTGWRRMLGLEPDRDR